MASISGKADPVVLRVTALDVIEALSAGLRDFQALPLYGLAIGAFFAAGGLIVVLSTTAFGTAYLAYPLAAGFALLGPFAAIFLYDVSRRRERGEVVKLRDIGSQSALGQRSAGWRSLASSFS